MGLTGEGDGGRAPLRRHRHATERCRARGPADCLRTGGKEGVTFFSGRRSGSVRHPWHSLLGFEFFCARIRVVRCSACAPNHSAPRLDSVQISHRQIEGRPCGRFPGGAVVRPLRRDPGALPARCSPCDQAPGHPASSVEPTDLSTVRRGCGWARWRRSPGTGARRFAAVASECVTPRPAFLTSQRTPYTGRPDLDSRNGSLDRADHCGKL